jgi:hypothetical protein
VIVRAGGLVAVVLCVALLPAAASADGGGVVPVSVTVADEQLQVVLGAPERPVKAGSPFLVEARVRSASSSPVLVTLHRPLDVLLRDDVAQWVPGQPAKDARVRWSACIESPGLYLLLASAEVDGVVVESLSEAVEVSGKKHGDCPKPWQD